MLFSFFILQAVSTQQFLNHSLTKVLKNRDLIEKFKDIEYLKFGSERQKLAFHEIKQHRILEILEKYNPILTGTIPIGIDLPESDLDIICQC